MKKEENLNNEEELNAQEMIEGNKTEMAEKIISLSKEIEHVSSELRKFQQLSTQYAIKIKELSAEIEKMKENHRKKLAETIIAILSNLKVFLASVKEEDTKKAIRIVEEQQMSVLRNMGIERKIVKAGDEFDSMIHNAVSTQETTNKEEDEKIAHAFSDVFVMNNKFLNVADVIVFQFKN